MHKIKKQGGGILIFFLIVQLNRAIQADVFLYCKGV